MLDDPFACQEWSVNHFSKDQYTFSSCKPEPPNGLLRHQITDDSSGIAAVCDSSTESRGGLIMFSCDNVYNPLQLLYSYDIRQ